jgi:hypothetical protein
MCKHMHAPAVTKKRLYLCVLCVCVCVCVSVISVAVAISLVVASQVAPASDTHAPQNRPWRTIGFRNAHFRIVRVFRVLTLYYECYVLPMTPTRYVAQSPRYTTC